LGANARRSAASSNNSSWKGNSKIENSLRDSERIPTTTEIDQYYKRKVWLLFIEMCNDVIKHRLTCICCNLGKDTLRLNLNKNLLVISNIADKGDV
jgi:hypothetical protein